MPRRSISLNSNPHSFASLNEFVDSVNEIPNGVLELGHGEPIHLYWVNRNSPVTFVTFSAAVSRRSAGTVPIFTGFSTTKHLSANVLMVSDPSLILSSDLNLAWYAGNHAQPLLQSDLTRIIHTLVGDSRVVLFGASGGGFAALDQASRLRNATVLAVNPQTDIRRYPAYPRYLQRCWPGLTDEHPPVNLTVSGEDTSAARVIYLQNSGDRSHVESHLNPFREALTDDVLIHFLSPHLGNGHVGPDSQSYRDLFSVVCEHESWNDLIAEIGSLSIHSSRARGTQATNPS